MVKPAVIITIIVIIIVVIAAALLLYFLVIKKKTPAAVAAASTACTLPPTVPTNFKITNATTTSITLSWDAQADAKAYTVFEGDDASTILSNGTIIYTELASKGTTTTATFSTPQNKSYLLQADNNCGSTDSNTVSYKFCDVEAPHPITDNTWYVVQSHTQTTNPAPGTTLNLNVSGIPDNQFPITIAIESIDIYTSQITKCVQNIAGGTINVANKNTTVVGFIAHADKLNPVVASGFGNCAQSDSNATVKCSMAVSGSNSWLARLNNVVITNSCGLQSNSATLGPLEICP